MKQFIHTLWTLPTVSSWRNVDGKKQMLINLYLYTISAWYIKKWGGKIDLYADSLGMWLLEHAPYDNFLCSFDYIDYKTMPCWATPKFLAMEFIKAPFTLIDGDVFIKSQRMFDEVTDNNCDLVVEAILDDTSDSYDAYFMSWHKHYFETHTSFVNDFSFLQTCNNGCITINNEELKKEYSEKYFQYREELFNTQEKVNDAWEWQTFIPDLIIEQMNLYEISKKYKRKGVINSAIGSNDSHMYDIFKPQFTNEYRHYAGKEKYHMSVEYFRNILKQLDYDLYLKTKEKEKEITEYLL